MQSAIINCTDQRLTETSATILALEPLNGSTFKSVPVKLILMLALLLKTLTSIKLTADVT